MTAAAASRTPVDALRRRLEAVPDPELPVLTLGQLGVVRAVRVDGDTAVVEVTPTYSGCPAMAVITEDLAAEARAAGYRADVRTVLSPPWTTDWISPEGRKALSDNGIAPPGPVAGGPVAVTIGRGPGRPRCPLCGSGDVEELARFGSTACKALWRCLDCREPFDYLKPL